MHDQKLTEELEFLRNNPDYFAFMYGHVKGLERNKQADQLFRRGVPQTAAAMVMEDMMKTMTDRFNRDAENYIWNPAALTFGKDYVPPTIMRPEFTGYEFMHKKTIDHPYLLPPSTGVIRWLTEFGYSETYSDGTTWNILWCHWDRQGGRVPAQIMEPPKLSAPYLVQLGVKE